MKTFLVAWLLLFASTVGHCCDVCGIYLGIQPNDRASSISLMWRYRRLEGNVLVGGAPSLLPKHGGHGAAPAVARNVHYRELYQVAELRADLWFTDRFAVLVSIPMVNNYQATDGYARSDVYGLGDPLFIARYLVANTKCKATDDRVVHRVMVGAGAKVPLGSTKAQYNNAEVPMDLQPGTGTWDVLASLEYKVRYRKNGLGVSMVGRYNTANSNAERLGHGLSTTAEYFHQFNLGENWKFAPSLGAYHELYGMDATNGETVQGTGSSTLFAHVGSRLWWRNWGISATFQLAVAHSLGALMVPNRERFVAGITYNIVKS